MTPGLEPGRAAALFERLPLVMYSLLLEPPYPTVYVSSQLESIFGLSREECLTNPDFRTSKVVPGDRSRFLGALGRLSETHEPVTVEYRKRLSTICCGRYASSPRAGHISTRPSLRRSSRDAGSIAGGSSHRVSARC